MSLRQMIGDVPLFKNFSEEEKKVFAKMEHTMLAFSKGDIIIKEGEDYTSLYLLIRGSAQVTRKGYDSPVGEGGDLLSTGQQAKAEQRDCQREYSGH